MTTGNDRPYRCRDCGAFYSGWTSHCPVCGLAGTMRPADLPPVGVVEKRQPTLGDAPDLPGTRIDTGVPGLNTVLGSDYRPPFPAGLSLPSVVLFGAAAGSGKTTLLLTMAARIKTKSLLYIATEQELRELKSNADRIGLGELLAGMPCVYTERMDEAFAKIRELDPRVVIVDPLNRLTDPPRDSGDRLLNRLRYAEAFKREAEVHHRAIILSSHLTKSSEISGLQEQPHLLSAVMKLDKWGPVLRMLHCPDKNRFGQIGVPAWFEIDKTGLRELSEPPADAAERRDGHPARRGPAPGARAPRGPPAARPTGSDARPPPESAGGGSIRRPRTPERLRPDPATRRLALVPPPDATARTPVEPPDGADKPPDA